MFRNDGCLLNRKGESRFAVGIEGIQAFFRSAEDGVAIKEGTDDVIVISEIGQ